MYTLYQMFGVPETADAEAIRQGWIKLMKRYHPDLNPTQDPDIPKKINAAYDVLRDPEERAKYDRWLYAKRNPYRFAPSIVVGSNVSNTTTINVSINGSYWIIQS